MREEIKKIKDYLYKREEIVFAYIFGSSISEEKFNDIDIAVYLKDEKIDPIDYGLSLSVEIEKIVKYRIDVKVINFLPLTLKYYITKGILLFTKDEELHEDFLCRVWKEYMDFKYVSNIYLKEL